MRVTVHYLVDPAAIGNRDEWSDRLVSEIETSVEHSEVGLYDPIIQVTSGDDDE